MERAFAFLAHAPSTNEQPLSHPHSITQGFEQSMRQYPNSSRDWDPHQGLPSVTVDINDWTFKGVNMAFFDSLMRGTSCVDAAGLEQ